VKYRSRRFKSSLIVWKQKLLTSRNLGLIVALLLLFVFIGPLVVALALQSSYASRIATHIEEVKPSRVAIILGAEVTSEGLSDAAEERVQAAVELYKAGKVQKLLISGDNRVERYNEPEKMTERAIKLGVAAADIQPDFAGRRTYDTCYRAKYIFGLTEVILVSQPLHLARSLYICNSLGLRATGYAADSDTIYYTENWFYEICSFVKAIWDVNLFPPTDIVLGDKIEIK